MATTHRQSPQSNASATKTETPFDSIMLETIQDMPRHKQVFSRVLHTKSVAWLSGLLARSIARPNALLFGGICSFTLTLLAYLLAKNLGYRLSGFESIGAFLLGWSMGLVFDLVHARLKKKH